MLLPPEGNLQSQLLCKQSACAGPCLPQVTLSQQLAAGSWRPLPEKVIRRLKMPPCSGLKDRGLMASLV